MSRKSWGYVLGGVGVLLILAALLGDSLWSGSTPGFGVGQIGALLLGIILLVIGLSLAFRGEPAAAAAPAAKVSAAPAATDGKADDLTRLEGIGPKLQDVLRSVGFKTYTDLASATPEAITRALKDSGVKVPFDAASWPEQASLAAKGDWSALDTLQASLTGGRKKAKA